jgi:hypothetical protein
VLAVLALAGLRRRGGVALVRDSVR